MQLINKQGIMVEVDLKNVDLIKSDSKKRKVFFHTPSGVFHLPSTPEELQQVFEPHGFRRIDRNRLINVDKISKWEKGTLFIGEKKYSVTRRNETIIRRFLYHK